MYVSAALDGDLGTLTTLRRLGVPWGAKNTLAEAVRAGCRMPAVSLLVEHGAPMGSRDRLKGELAQAVRRGSLRAEDAAWCEA